MVIFTDGMDAQVTEEGKSAFDVLGDADRANIPVYFIRVGDPERQKKGVTDEAWAAAVARTGGRFYNAADEATIVRAIQDINRAAPGRIDIAPVCDRATEVCAVCAGCGGCCGRWRLRCG